MSSKSAEIEQEAIDDDAVFALRKLAIRVLWVILTIVVFVFAYSHLTRDDVFPIQVIKVSGEFEQVYSRDIRPIITAGVTGNFFTVNVSDIYQRLMDLSWVEKVWIHRIWPNTIKVDFQEQKPIAILKNRGLINQNGEVFSQKVNAFDKTLPMFIVAKNYTLDAIEQFKINNKILGANGLEARVFNFDERKSQKITLSNGIELILGRMDVEQRLNKFVRAYHVQLKNETKKILRVDLRYTNGLAVGW